MGDYDRNIHDRRTLRVVSIIDPSQEPEGEDTCSRHAREMHSIYPHVKHNGDVYHTYGDKRLFYCPQCCQDALEQHEIDPGAVDHPAKVSLVLAARDTGPHKDAGTTTPLWEVCEEEEHHDAMIEI